MDDTVMWLSLKRCMHAQETVEMKNFPLFFASKKVCQTKVPFFSISFFAFLGDCVAHRTK